MDSYLGIYLRKRGFEMSRYRSDYIASGEQSPDIQIQLRMEIWRKQHLIKDFAAMHRVWWFWRTVRGCWNSSFDGVLHSFYS